MTKIQIPRNGDLGSISGLFDGGAIDKRVEIEITPESFFKVDGLAFLTAKCLDLQRLGVEILISGNDSDVLYLDRMDFQSHLGLAQATYTRHPEQGRFLPIKLIGIDKDGYDTTDQICDLVLRHFDDGSKFLPAMEWMVNELIDNIIIHAEAPVPGVVCAQFYPKRKVIEVAIYDMGRGLRESLATTRDVPTHKEALELALKRGVTRDPEVGMGYGMAGSLEISKSNGGDFRLWSGDATYSVKGGEVLGIEKIPMVQGTGIYLSIRTDHPVKLAETWIGGGDWGFIENQAEKLEETGGMDVAAECVNTGSRPPGKYLRRKIVAILPEMEVPLMLDFSNVRAASSSFLDELLGRLAFEFGTDVFKDRVRLTGMEETILKMANVVIAQRTGEIDLDKEQEKEERASAREPESSKTGDSSNGWLVRTAVEPVGKMFSVDVPVSGSILSGIKDGDGLALEGGDGKVFGFARLFRRRSGLDSTRFYFDAFILAKSPTNPKNLGLAVGKGDEVALRQSWSVFTDAMEKATGTGFEGLESFAGKDLAEQAYLRELFKFAVIDDLLGPAQGPEEEIVGMNVRNRYLVGKLAPKESGIEADQDEDLGGEGSASGEGEVEVEASKSQTLIPSSLGFTFCVDGDAQSVELEALWGRYERGESETETKENGKPLRAWRRVPSGGKVTISLREGPIDPVEPDSASPGVHVQGIVREKSSKGDRMVTVFLVNDQERPEENQDSAWVFQPNLIVRGIEGDAIFRKRPVLEADGDDKERESLEMVYRRRVEFAVGHGIAIHSTPSPQNVEQAVEVRTSVMPEYENPVTETPGLNLEDRPAMRRLVDEGFLDMAKLAGLERPELLEILGILVGDYKEWISDQRARVTGELLRYENAAKDALERCDVILERLQEGVDSLANKNDALEAFRFANLAMAAQRVRGVYSLKKRRGEDVTFDSLNVTKNRSWRPFQLAFILLSIPALADPTHSDRTDPLQANADLLWFPTGGGKTEAYLGVAAFAMSIRRLQGTVAGLDSSRGLAVVMRYTLRLLTIQQFQRATALLCAMEILRKANTPKWGGERFTLGLWVGNKVTPGTTEQSHRSIEAERDGKMSTGSTPAQLTFCPWCGNDILPGRDIHVDKGAGRTVICCGDKLSQCEFSKAKSSGLGLPVVVVDDEIYRRPPSMMIGTVDKFAMMAWRGEVRTLFGKVSKECDRHGLLWPDSKCSGTHNASGGHPRVTTKQVPPLRPPDLIIQDEFHLISGPLGTMVGLYETAIDELASWSFDGKVVRPKVIASTATVRKAKDQVRNVFFRQVAVFPPHGLDIEDNFFSVQRPPEEKPGRLYVGVCSPGSARPAVLIQLYVALLTAGQSLFDHFGQAADPYMTVVGYFNSLRELGGMKRLAEDDVQTRSFRVLKSKVARPGLAQRSVRIVDELTSRVSSKEIPKKLDQLEIKMKKKWAKGETRAIDVVLATNMLSVGVDVNRIGLMAVNGQPKNTAEYIQATSRVGRAFPGIVFTVLTWSRPRDLSHYETFEHYHSTFYKHVEAQSVTPFAPRALDRGLTGMMVSLLRHGDETLNPNLGAGELDSPTKPQIAEAKASITNRAWKITNKSAAKQTADAMISERFDTWVNEAARPGRDLGYDARGGQGTLVAFLKKPGSHRWDITTAPMSLREVEAGVNLVMDNSKIESGPPWTSKISTPPNDQ